jgi:hypothetical protein
MVLPAVGAKNISSALPGSVIEWALSSAVAVILLSHPKEYPTPLL